jgi:transcriptional regulator with XRE-family HTH domain
MISASQIRAARGLLDISATELAQLSGVDLRTIQRFERSPGVPPSRSGTLEKLRDTLEVHGIKFLGDPVASPGVQLNRKEPPHKSAGG